jgi:hypothetical protein
VSEQAPAGAVPTLDQIILEHLIKRLLPKVGNVTRAHLYRHPEEWSGARGRWAQALIRARSALASGDDEQIRVAALFCPPLERTGRDEIEKARDEIEKANRRKGGEKRLEDLTKKRDAARAKYGPIFQANLQGGVRHQTRARNAVKSAMEHDEPGSASDRRKLLRWFPDPL